MALQLSVSQKYRVCQIVSGLGVLAAAYFVSRMGPYDTPHHNKAMFALLISSVFISLPFAVATYYYRSKRREIATDAVQIAALAQAGQKPKPTNLPSKDQGK